MSIYRFPVSSHHLMSVQPGDMTRYYVSVLCTPDGLWVSCNLHFPLHQMDWDDVTHFIDEHPETLSEPSDYSAKCEGLLDDYYIEHLSEETGCNPWTALAVVKATYLAVKGDIQ